VGIGGMIAIGSNASQLGGVIGPNFNNKLPSNSDPTSGYNSNTSAFPS
jgi:hypothetical protein